MTFQPVISDDLRDRIKELETKLLLAKAREKELREALATIENQIHSRVMLRGAELDGMYEVVEKALASNGIETLKAELDGVERVLAVLRQIEGADNNMVECHCPLCGEPESNDHAKTCELSALIIELEKKQKLLTKTIGEIGND